jgi:hypothetical protein
MTSLTRARTAGLIVSASTPHPQKQQHPRRIIRQFTAYADGLAAQVCRLDDMVDGIEDGRMQTVVRRRHPRIVPVNGMQVPGEIIRSHGEKIHAFRQGGCQKNGRRYFNHHTHAEYFHGYMLFQQFPLGVCQQPQGLVQFTDTADHGK